MMKNILPKGVLSKDISLFCKGPYYIKSHLANEKREKILSSVLSIDKDSGLFTDNKWKNLRDNFSYHIEGIYTGPGKYSKYTITRTKKFANYDFDLKFYKGESVVQTNKIEFKNNKTSLEDLHSIISYKCSPTYSSIFSNNGDYTHYFYEKYLETMIDIYGHTKSVIPSLQKYSSNVLKLGSKFKDPFFIYLINNDKDLQLYDEKAFKEKNSLVDESIENFLNHNLEHTDTEFLTQNLMKKQNDKIFFMWKEDRFYVEMFKNGDLILKPGSMAHENNEIKIKNLNNGTISLKLNWGFRKGVLIPGFKVKFKTK